VLNSLISGSTPVRSTSLPLRRADAGAAKPRRRAQSAFRLLRIVRRICQPHHRRKELLWSGCLIDRHQLCLPAQAGVHDGGYSRQGQSRASRIWDSERPNIRGCTGRVNSWVRIPIMHIVSTGLTLCLAFSPAAMRISIEPCRTSEHQQTCDPSTGSPRMALHWISYARCARVAGGMRGSHIFWLGRTPGMIRDCASGLPQLRSTDFQNLRIKR